MKKIHLSVAAATLALFLQPATAQRSGASAGGSSLEAIKQNVSCLGASASQLNKEFATHLKSQGTKPTPDEMALLEGTEAMVESVNGLVRESNARVSEGKVFRAFHLVDYSAKDLSGLASKAGYSKALSPFLTEITSHVGALADLGYRNPRVKLEAAGGGGLLSRGGLFRRDDEAEERPMLRQPQHAHGHVPTQTGRPTGGPPPRSLPVPSESAQRPIPRSLPEGPGGQPQRQPSPGGGGIGDLLRTILGGGR